MTPSTHAKRYTLFVFALTFVCAALWGPLTRARDLPSLVLAVAVGLFLSCLMLYSAWFWLWRTRAKSTTIHMMFLGFAFLFTALISQRISLGNIDLLTVIIAFYPSLFYGFVFIGLRYFRFHLVCDELAIDLESPTAWQFRIRDLMLWTAGLALVLGIGRPLFATADFTNEDLAETAMSFAAFGGFQGLLCIPIMLVRGRSKWWGIGLGICLLVPALLTVYSAFVEPWVATMLLHFLCFEATFFGAILLLTGILARAGWRLERLPPPKLAALGSRKPTVSRRWDSTWQRHQSFFLVLVGQLGLTLLLGLFIREWDYSHLYRLAFLLGVVAAQPLLVSLWFTLYAAPLRFRLPAALTTILIASTLYQIGINHDRSSMTNGFEFCLHLTQLVLLLGFFIATLLVWRWGTRRRIVARKPSPWNEQGNWLSRWGALSIGIPICILLLVAILSMTDFEDMPPWKIILEYGAVPIAWQTAGLFLALMPALFLAGVFLHPKRRWIWLFLWMLAETIVLALMYFWIDKFLIERVLENWELLGYYLLFAVGLASSTAGTLGILWSRDYQTEQKGATPTPEPAPSSEKAHG